MVVIRLVLREQMAHLEGFDPPPPSSEVWRRPFSPTFAMIRSCSLPLLQANRLRRADNGEQARSPATAFYCGQIVVKAGDSLKHPRRHNLRRGS